ncbi:MAG: phosphoribosylamine--glycine ligase [Spirulinaceae cyanobacterium]
MKVLVVGNGGREHALAWKLLQSEQVDKVFCVPGNGGTALLEGCQNLALSGDDFEGLSKFALVNGISLIVVGPEVPLALGVTDRLLRDNLKVFGPTQAGAQIESSKSWAKELMAEAGIPTARSKSFTELAPAQAYVIEKGAPIVVKADGLAAGKGVTVASTVEEAKSALEALFAKGFTNVVVEEFLVGEEVSVFALTDGISLRTLITAQDHKRIGEGDTGENTGGMGAYAPAPLVNPQLMERIEQEILQPTIEALQQKGIDYRGVLYAGLMISPQGDPFILEFNCRFGDPETQVLLPLLETPLEEILLACAEKRLEKLPPIEWKQGSAVCVVAASQGYPGPFEKGFTISGIEKAEELETMVFHAGTKLMGGKPVTNGGRVLGVTAVGESFEQAIEQVYQGISAIDFTGIYFRNDIGHRVK